MIDDKSIASFDSTRESMALTGIRVVDLSRSGPSQAATTMLADFGADVIAVGQPGFAERRAAEGSVSEEFANSVGRNKRSILIDLREDRGRTAFMKLAATADVVVEGFRPGVAAKLGVDYASVRKVNEGLIYCSVSGFGQSGPYAQIAAHDIQFQAVAGLLAEDATGCFQVPSNVWADHLATTSAVMGILMSLAGKHRTGQGQYLDLAYLDAAVMAATASRDPMLRGAYPCYNVYECSDGRHIALGIREPWFWKRLCEMIGRPDWIPFQRPEGELLEQMRGYFRELFRTRPREEWLRDLANSDIEASPVNRGTEVSSDPQVLHRALLVSTPVGTHPTSEDVAPPIRLSNSPWRVWKSRTSAGDSTDAILAEVGYDSVSRAQLRKDGIVA